MSHSTNANTAQREFNNLEDRLKTIEAKLASLETLISNSIHDTASNKQFARSDPPIYESPMTTPHINLDEWLYKMHVKLQTPPLTTFDNNAKIHYVASRLTGNAFSQVKKQLPGATELGIGTSYHREFHTATQVLAALHQAYSR